MAIWLRRLAACLLLLCVLPCCPAYAQEQEAENISSRALIRDQVGFTNLSSWFDGKDSKGTFTAGNAEVTLSSDKGIGSLYIVFGKEYGAYTVTDNATGISKTFGSCLYLHEFLDLTGAFGKTPTSVTLRFESGRVAIFELYAFTEGKTPDFVQKWDAPADGKTDLVLFSTHGDDEQIFFAGMLPYYAGELGLQVQVVYLTDHRNQTNVRVHEMLNGLWSVGVTAYPVFGAYNDFFVVTKEQAYWSFNNLGWTKEDLVGYVVEQLRRFKPLVVVGHDFNGEYGHGQHMAYADMLASALEVINDPNKYPETAEKYGVWDVPKAYFHLYEENKIIMDWDQPLEHFGGMTAFEVTRDLGYPCHESQYWDFANYIVTYRSAAAVQNYNPREYGLYRTTVGKDVLKNDLFENLIPYADQERLAQVQQQEEAQAKLEEQARLEKERSAEEERMKAEQAKQEEERRQQEEQARREAEQRAQEEKQRQEEQAAKEKMLWTCGIAAVSVALALVIVSILLLRRKKKRRGQNYFEKT